MPVNLYRMLLIAACKCCCSQTNACGQCMEIIIKNATIIIKSNIKVNSINIFKNMVRTQSFPSCYYGTVIRCYSQQMGYTTILYYLK